MSDTALVLHYFDGSAAPAKHTERRDVPAEWALGSAFLAAVLVALMTVVGVFADRAGGADNEWVTWASLWFVAFVVVAGGRNIAARLGRRALEARAAWRERTAIARADREIRRAAQGDPRVLRELQILRDRAEWRR